MVDRNGQIIINRWSLTEEEEHHTKCSRRQKCVQALRKHLSRLIILLLQNRRPIKPLNNCTRKINTPTLHTSPKCLTQKKIKNIIKSSLLPVTFRTDAMTSKDMRRHSYFPSCHMISKDSYQAERQHSNLQNDACDGSSNFADPFL